MRRTLFSDFFILFLFITTVPLVLSAQQVDSKLDSKLPWSVRMTESEMIRCPESWQLDFQPKLKWDYCHGLELGLMYMMRMAMRRFVITPSLTRTQW